MADTDTTPEDDFGKFFEELSAMGDKTPPKTFGAETPPAEPVVETPAEPVVEVPAEPDPTPATPEPVAASSPPAAPAAPAQTEELLERFVRAVETRQPAPPPVPQVAEPRVYTDDDVKVLTEFEKDYPDIAKALQLVMKGYTLHNNAQLMEQVARIVGPQMEGLQTVQVNQQLSALRQAIPDYDTIRDPVIEWVNTDKTIPSYLREAYKGVIEQGDVSAISHMVDVWRQANGKAAPPPVAAKKANELSEAAKQAAESLAPVVSKRTVTAPSTPTSYEDAFEAAAEAMARA